MVLLVGRKEAGCVLRRARRRRRRQHCGVLMLLILGQRSRRSHVDVKHRLGGWRLTRCSAHRCAVVVPSATTSTTTTSGRCSRGRRGQLVGLVLSRSVLHARAERLLARVMRRSHRCSGRASLAARIWPICGRCGRVSVLKMAVDQQVARILGLRALSGSVAQYAVYRRHGRRGAVRAHALVHKSLTNLPREYSWILAFILLDLVDHNRRGHFGL